jgi:outer membrane receptor protein involved in Fe transport
MSCPCSFQRRRRTRSVSAIVAGAQPAVYPSTLPNPNGSAFGRKALTGDIGLVANTEGHWSPFVRFGRSYRHPNLEEMFFAGPATAGTIAPNVKVKPERGNNFDAERSTTTPGFLAVSTSSSTNTNISWCRI